MNTNLPHPLSVYATDSMVLLWTDEFRFRVERLLWCKVLQYQTQIGGVHIKHQLRVMDAYAKASEDPILVERILQRERITKHDVKARIDEYNRVASIYYGGPIEHIHLGMTSADIVDNVDLIRMRTGLQALANLCASNSDEKARLEAAIEQLPFRGIRGPVGTQQDQIDLMGEEHAQAMDLYLAHAFGFTEVMGSVGQVYPRSLDHQVGSALMGASFLYLAAEATGKTDEHGLPAPYLAHNPWLLVLRGYFRMVGEMCGNQWNEGDVSTSVIRRVCLPGMFLATDCLLRGVKP